MDAVVSLITMQIQAQDEDEAFLDPYGLEFEFSEVKWLQTFGCGKPAHKSVAAKGLEF